MRLGIRKDMDWEYIGAILAADDGNNQAAFFRGFVRECRSWGTSFQIEQQLAHVNLKLTPEERKTLSMITYDENNK